MLKELTDWDDLSFVQEAKNNLQNTHFFHILSAFTTYHH